MPDFYLTNPAVPGSLVHVPLPDGQPLDVAQWARSGWVETDAPEPSQEAPADLNLDHRPPSPDGEQADDPLNLTKEK